MPWSWAIPAASAAIGFLGGGSQQAGTTTTTTSRDLPEWLKPYLTGNLSGAQATRNQLTNTDNGLMNLAVPGYAATLRGDYLNPESNPWLKSTFNTSADLVNSRINSIFEGGNRYGSGQQASAIGTADTSLANQIYGGNYQAERARQAAAIGGLPAFNLGNVQSAMAPYSSFSGLFPNLWTGSESSPYYTNPLGNALGGAGLGYMLSRGMGGAGSGAPWDMGTGMSGGTGGLPW